MGELERSASEIEVDEEPIEEEIRHSKANTSNNNMITKLP
jgi:hypothetical protein